MDLTEHPAVHKIYFKHRPDIAANIFNDSQNGDLYYPREPLRDYWYRKVTDFRRGDAPFEINPAAIDFLAEFTRNKYAKDGLTPTDYLRRYVEGSPRFTLLPDHYPTLPAEILDDYYANAPLIWQRFCANIHFTGSEGVIMMADLLVLPNNPAYRWEFVRE